MAWNNECQNCWKLMAEANKRGDIRTASKYIVSGRYEKVSEGSSSFSYSKAALGSLVFGPVGAVAGINGKKTVIYRCNKCGHTIERRE